MGPNRARGTTARAIRALAAVLIGGLAFALLLTPTHLAEPADAAEVAGAGLTGCRGAVVSRDADGDVLDEATGAPVDDVTDPEGDDAFTASNPFEVRADGTVDWQGETDDVLVGGHWSLDVWGITLTDGPADNTDRSRTGEGTLTVDTAVPSGLTGLVKVDGRLTGEGDTCTGSGWVRLDGDPAFTLPWLAGLGLVGLGLALAVVAQPRQVWS